MRSARPHRSGDISFIKRIQFKGVFFFLTLSIACCNLFAQKATVMEEKQVFRTYPFSDPDPVPRMNKIYPYFRFDGYSAESVAREWQIVTLENPHIRVLVAPEIGGKVLGAFEKSTGRPFIYFNKVIKFRDIAMRGPWTSGGIEFNFGAIGHAPTTATPVDYLIRENEDGSVSCFVGALDLPSRTEWRVEIRLPEDKAYFETRSFWFNPTELNTSLYHWMNSSADAGDDLRYYFPGNLYIDHGGRAYPWPVHENGKDISVYGNNDFGSYKSYHVIGVLTDFFGGIWEKDRFGFGHWSPYGDKPGKKIWIWGLSRQGQIWEDLLTDTDLGNRQYTEIQSGLLFNQAGGRSSRTPFKHLFFVPCGVERFREVWFPIHGVSGIVDANEYGVLNVERDDGVLKFELCPLQRMEEALVVMAGEEEIYRKQLRLEPMGVFRDSLKFSQQSEFDVALGQRILVYGSRDVKSKRMNRPMEADEAFDWESVYGLYMDGSERARQRDCRGALEKYLACFEKDPLYTPALVGIAENYYRRMEYGKALEYIQKALANDTYDPDANFIYGIVNRKLGHLTDAKDGFAIATRSMKTRSSACVQLAELAFLEDDLEWTRVYADRALDFNRYNLNALKLLALTHRKMGKEQEAEKVLYTILGIDALNHFARFEKTFLDSRPENFEPFTTMIRNELPHETVLELAIFYVNLGLAEEAIRILANDSSHPVVNYWLAYLYNTIDDDVRSREYLSKALQGSPSLVYPFRHETVDVLKWALEKSDHWKTKYYLGLIYWCRNRIDVARQYFIACAETPDFAPFYVARGNLWNEDESRKVLEDYHRALELDANQWRFYSVLAKYHARHGEHDKFLIYAKNGADRFPDNYILQFEYARALLYNRRFDDCLLVLRDIRILPHEGAQYGRDIYRQACMLYALDHIRKKNYRRAVVYIEKARLWPENLGVGEPYDVDNRLEDFIEAYCHHKMGNTGEAKTLFDRIRQYTDDHGELYNSNAYVSARVLEKSGERAEAKKLMDAWIAAYPEDTAARWSHATFYGEHKKAEKILENMLTESQGTPWNPVRSDPHFKLVLEIAKVIEW